MRPLVQVGHLTLNDTVHVVRILCDLLHDLVGLGFEERRIEFGDGDLIQMALHALGFFLTTPRQVSERALGVGVRRVGIHEPHDFDVFRTGSSYDQEENERGDGERVYVHRDVL